MENAQKAIPVEVKELYKKQVKDLQEIYVTPTKAMIENNPAFCYRAVAYY